MNQPTEDRIKRLEEEQKQLKEEVRRLREQQTEPIRIDRLEIDRGGTHKRLDEIEENTNVTKIEMQGARADILSIQATQSDHGEYLKEDRQIQHHHTEKLDQHTEVLGQLVSFAESHDTLLKDIKTAQDEQGQKLDQQAAILQEILNRLPPR